MNPLDSSRWSRGAMLSLTLMSLLLTACLELTSTTCPSGLTCPSGMMCAAQQDICIDASPSCGDGVVQASIGEACDDGNILDGDGCSQDCKSVEDCGNSRVDRGEVCDDGNQTSGDGCSADCRSDERCGNGTVDEANGEACDDGNKISGDGCSSDCRSDERCGNGITDALNGEICDDGNTVGGDGCSSDCRSGEGCGNHVLDPGEQCDDGNHYNDDDCVSTEDMKCIHARCGDGFPKTKGPNPEQCDTGRESAACNLDCTFTECGDGIVNTSAGEQCDNGTPDAFCTSECTVSWCGDGILNKAAGEECDIALHTDCLSNCKLDRCGNGVLDEGEQCDDGNRDACGTCNADCSEEITPKSSLGTITIIDGNKIIDESIFSISDGVHLPILFEFDRGNGSSSPSHVRIKFNPHSSPKDIASAVKEAIERKNEYHLNITAWIDKKNENAIHLKHHETGGHGNQPIIKTSTDSAYTVNGMSGGRSKDCPIDTDCVEPDDCARGLVCNKPQGSPKGTCQQPPPPPEEEMYLWP